MLDVIAPGELLIDFAPAGAGSEGYPILAAHPGGAAVSELLRLAKAPQELNEAELRCVASFACAAASLSTQSHGGIGSVPDREAVERALAGGEPSAE